MSTGADSRHPPIWQWGVMIVAVALTLIAVVVMLRAWSGRHTSRPAASIAAARAEPANNAPPATVRAVITSGGVTVERSLPTASFALLAGESLDPRVPSDKGRTTAVLRIPFSVGQVRAAFIGAEIRNGQLIVSRDGVVLLSTAAGDEPIKVLTSAPVAFSGGVQSLDFDFTWAGDLPVRFRPLWRPEAGESILPIPARTGRLLQERWVHGMSIVQQKNCAACHVPRDQTLRSVLSASVAPSLRGVGDRLTADWLRNWILSSQTMHARSNMPALLLDSRMAPVADLILEYLQSRADVTSKETTTSRDVMNQADMVATGDVLYHDIGCVACHGPLRPPSDTAGAFMPSRGFESVREDHYSLDHVGLKFASEDALAAYLMNPLVTHPSGMMPDMKLSPMESHALSVYLLSQWPRSAGTVGDARSTDSERVTRGGRAFVAMGCAQCHTSDAPDIADPYMLPLALEDLTQLESGCLSARPVIRAADFGLHPFERASIRAFLESLPTRRSQRLPIDELALVFTRLNCAACHGYHAELGPDRIVASYFRSATEADLGDEGRIPPDLTDVGGRLNQSWMHNVLSEGGQSRPYLAVRMPQFGVDHVHELPRLLAAAGGIDDLPERTPAFSVEAAAIGRELAGANAFNCIQCHNVAGHAATGTPGPDLALAAERLRYDAFARWLLDPSKVRPGTRMPTFFFSGFSAFRDFYDGRAQDQVDALWAYVSQGEQLPLPEGLSGDAGLTLDVTDEPLVFRTFMKEAGVRAIACGFPEQVHGAFDADRCEMTIAWQGRFLDAGGAWANRGGTETNPEAVQWKLGRTHTLSLIRRAEEPRRAAFHGYRLDTKRRPVFLYSLGDDPARVSIKESIAAHTVGNRRSILQRFDFEGPPQSRIQIELAGRTLHRSSPEALRMDEDTYILTTDDRGMAVVEMELTW